MDVTWTPDPLIQFAIARVVVVVEGYCVVLNSSLFFFNDTRPRARLRAAAPKGKAPRNTHTLPRQTPLRTPYLPLTLQPWTSLQAPKGTGNGRPDTPPPERFGGDRDPWATNPDRPIQPYLSCTARHRPSLPEPNPPCRHNSVIGLRKEELSSPATCLSGAWHKGGRHCAYNAKCLSTDFDSLLATCGAVLTAPLSRGGLGPPLFRPPCGGSSVSRW